MRAVIYVCFFEEETIHAAVDELMDYAGKAGMEVTRVITEKAGVLDDFGYPDRHLLLECKEFCRQERPDMLLVPRLSNLDDNAFSIVGTVDSLSKAGVSVYIKNLDLATLQKDGTPNPAWTLLREGMLEAHFIDGEFFRSRLKAGRERYKITGGRLGRPKGTGMTPEQTIRKYPGVASRIMRNESEGTKETIDEIASGEGVSRSTVKKVKKVSMRWLKTVGEARDAIFSFYDEQVGTEEEEGEDR